MPNGNVVGTGPHSQIIAEGALDGGVCARHVATSTPLAREAYWVTAALLPGASSNVTLTVGAPAVFSWPGHTLVNGDPLWATSTGNIADLPKDKFYYVSNANQGAGTFEVVYRPGEASLAASGAQGGTHTMLTGKEVKTSSISTHLCDVGFTTYRTVTRLNTAGGAYGDKISVRYWSNGALALGSYPTNDCSAPPADSVGVYGSPLSIDLTGAGQAGVDMKVNGVAKGHFGLAGRLIGSTGDAANDLAIVAQSGRDIVFVLDGGAKIVKLSTILTALGL